MLIPQVPDMESIHKKITGLEDYIESLQRSLKKNTQTLTEQINGLKVKKAEKIALDNNTAEINMLRGKLSHRPSFSMLKKQIVNIQVSLYTPSTIKKFSGLELSSFRHVLIVYFSKVN